MFEDSLKVLEDILTYPKSLESFSLSGMGWTSNASSWTWSAIRSLLSLHEGTLTKIILGPLALDHQSYLINFTDIKCLMHLQVSMHDMRYTPIEASASLLAPLLEVLTFD